MATVNFTELRDPFVHLILPYVLREGRDKRGDRVKLALVSKLFAEWVNEVPPGFLLRALYLSELEEYYNTVYFNGCYGKNAYVLCKNRKTVWVFLNNKLWASQKWQINGKIERIIRRKEGLWFLMTDLNLDEGFPSRFYPEDLVNAKIEQDLTNLLPYIPSAPDDAKVKKQLAERKRALRPELERTPEELGFKFVPFGKFHRTLINTAPIINLIFKWNNSQEISSPPESRVESQPESQPESQSIPVSKERISYNGLYIDCSGHWFCNKRKDGDYVLA